MPDFEKETAECVLAMANASIQQHALTSREILRRALKEAYDQGWADGRGVHRSKDFADHYGDSSSR